MIVSRRFGTHLPAEPGRYRLVVSPLCPWCRRVSAAVRMLGLTDAIALTYADGRGDDGFTLTSESHSYDTDVHAATVREIYRREPEWNDGDPTTVPLLLDMTQGKGGRIVACESRDLLIDFATQWPHPHGAPDLLPAHARDAILARVDVIDDTIAAPIGQILHDNDPEAARETLKRGLAAIEETIDPEAAPTLADLALFAHLTALLASEGDTHLRDLPTVKAWFNARVDDPAWLPDNEREACFGGRDPRIGEGSGLTYAQAGVDIEAGDQAVALMRDAVAATYTPDVITDSGAFAGMVDASVVAKMKRPLLATSTDGVGTKVAIAQALDIHDTIGHDLVGMVVDDIVVTGARPLLMTDYIACGHVDPVKIAAIVRGIAQACAAIDTPLVGGETAEHPGLMGPNEYDIAGAATGIVDAERALGAERVQEGDVLLALASSGLHSNGYSLVRAVVEASGLSLEKRIEEFGRTLGEELLEPTRLYTKVCLDMLEVADVAGLHALSHITGGGLGANMSRVMPEGLAATIDRASWQIPPVFDVLQRLGDVPWDDLEQTLNLGVGMVAVCAPEAVDKLAEVSGRHGIDSWELGRVCRRDDIDAHASDGRIVEGAKGVDAGAAYLHGTYRS